MLKYSVITLILNFYYTTFVECTVILTTSGLVKGKVNNFGNTSYYSYEGIPYAEPPIGDLRFRPPVPKQSWTYVLDATAPGSVCPQELNLFRRDQMSENCLFLNIYTPVSLSKEIRPVLIYLPGGYYVLGGANSSPVLGPQMLMQKNFVLVTLNYRLGALGFLSLGTPDASGNASLKDIILALKWIKNNIEKFGGDSSKICLGGTGVGASLVHYLTLTNATTGLFQRALIQSGSAVSYKALQINPRNNALKLAKNLGIKCTDNVCLLQKLKKVNAFTISSAVNDIMSNDPQRAFIGDYFFAPCVEMPSSVALITRNPLDIIRTDGLIQKVPVMTGFNDQEGLEIFMVIEDNSNFVNNLNENFELCIPPNIQYPRGSRRSIDLAESIREFYFNGGNISIFNTQNYINLISDTTHIFAIDQWMGIYKSKEINSPVYLDVFEFDGDLNWLKILKDITYPGAAHSDAEGYIFVTNVTESKLQNVDCKSKYIADSLQMYLKRFILYGDPTPTCIGKPRWLEAGPQRRYLVIGDETFMVYERPLKERLDFWYDVYAKYYEYQNKKG